MSEISADSYVSVTSDVAIAGFEMVRTSGGDLLGLNAQDGDEQLTQLFFPQVAGLILMASGIGAVVLFLPWMSENTGLLMAVSHFEEVAADHVNCSGHPAPPTSVLPLESVQTRFEQVFGQMGDRYRLIETRICRIGDFQVFHYFFQGDNRSVSVVLEERSDPQHLALNGDERQRALHGVTVSLIRSDSLTLAAFELSEYFVYLVVEQVDPEAVFQLADRVLPSIQAAL